MFEHKKTGWAGFTLIELLIVVAIIAILAAIAVPNFLEAQTRSKVSRAAADMRSIRTAIEAYAVDNNKYPETDFNQTYPSTSPGYGMIRLTTPMAYLTSVPTSPFQEERLGTAASTSRHAIRMKTILYVRALPPASNPPGFTITDTVPTGGDGKDDDYNRDRLGYLGGGSLSFINSAGISAGDWMMKSVGPDNVDDRSAIQSTDVRVYDPTNGTISRGDLIVFSDTQGFASQRQ